MGNGALMLITRNKELRLRTWTARAGKIVDSFNNQPAPDVEFWLTDAEVMAAGAGAGAGAVEVVLACDGNT